MPGGDPETGETFESTLHRVRAERLIQDDSTSIFISELGEVVAEWPTDLVVSVTWGARVEAENLGSEAQVSSEERPSQTLLKAKLERWRSELFKDVTFGHRRSSPAVTCTCAPRRRGPSRAS